MNLHIDLGTNQLIKAPGVVAPVASISVKRGDQPTFELYFYSDGITPATLPTGSSIVFAAKAAGKYDSTDVAVFAGTWTTPGNGAFAYMATPSFNTTELDTLLNRDAETANDLASITLMAEISWLSDSKQSSTQTFNLVVNNDVYRGNEGEPSPATPVYPLPSDIATKADLAEVSGGSGGSGGSSGPLDVCYDWPLELVDIDKAVRINAVGFDKGYFFFAGSQDGQSYLGTSQDFHAFYGGVVPYLEAISSFNGIAKVTALFDTTLRDTFIFPGNQGVYVRQADRIQYPAHTTFTTTGYSWNGVAPRDSSTLGLGFIVYGAADGGAAAASILRVAGTSLESINLGSPPPAAIKGAIYGSGECLLFGGLGEVYSSTDGVTWDKAPANFFADKGVVLARTIQGVGHFVVANSLSGGYVQVDNSLVYFSEDGATWTILGVEAQYYAFYQACDVFATSSATYLVVGGTAGGVFGYDSVKKLWAKIIATQMTPHGPTLFLGVAGDPWGRRLVVAATNAEDETERTGSVTSIHDYVLAGTSQRTSIRQILGQSSANQAPSYTASTQAEAYTGATDSEAKLTDLNALRTSYESLRTSFEEMRTKLIDMGIFTA